MRDVQNEPDYRNIPIDKVGIKNLRYPIKVLDRCNGYQHTVATINMYVDLPHRNKGTHMSRFVEILNQYRLELSLKKISDILAEMKTHLNAASAHIEIAFPYFIEKRAPVSDSPRLMDYSCRFVGASNSDDRLDLLARQRRRDGDRHQTLRSVVGWSFDLLDDIDRWRHAGERIAIARVVDVEGSGPRDPGAAMAVTESGEVAGSVSGGCVEGAVVAEALAILAGDRAPGVITFGHSDDEAFAVGLTCGGTIHLFIEELDW